MDEQQEKMIPAYEPGNNFFSKLDNFWYHNKWKVIIIGFLVITFTICFVQACSSKSPDLYVMYAGPYKFGQTDAIALESAFSSIASDRDGDGLCRAELVDIYVMSDEQITGAVAEAEARGEKVTVNYELFKNNREMFDQQILAGDVVICLLDPFLYEEVKAAGGFLPLAEVLGETPEYAVDEYSVRIVDTPIGEYFSVLSGLGEDTLFCVRRISSFSFLRGEKRTRAYHEYCLDVFRNAFSFSADTE